MKEDNPKEPEMFGASVAGGSKDSRGAALLVAIFIFILAEFLFYVANISNAASLLISGGVAFVIYLIVSGRSGK